MRTHLIGAVPMTGAALTLFMLTACVEPRPLEPLPGPPVPEDAFLAGLESPPFD